MSNANDILGNALTDAEQAMLASYRSLEGLLVRDDLAPCARANVQEAVASLWQVLNDLGVIDERPTGV